MSHPGLSLFGSALHGKHIGLTFQRIHIGGCAAAFFASRAEQQSFSRLMAIVLLHRSRHLMMILNSLF
jgi:hypothetical protein